MSRKPPSTAFKPGHQKLGGRPKGQPNHATVEVREAARLLVEDPDYRHALARRLHSGRLAPAVETMLWAYAFGKPHETHELSADLSLLTKVVHEHHDA